MEFLIKEAFAPVEVIGPHVEQGHYDLLGPQGEIILPHVWETVIEPDWTITMHMWPMTEEKEAEPLADVLDGIEIVPGLPPPPPPAPSAPGGAAGDGALLSLVVLKNLLTLHREKTKEEERKAATILCLAWWEEGQGYQGQEEILKSYTQDLCKQQRPLLGPDIIQRLAKIHRVFSEVRLGNLATGNLG